MPTRQPTLPTNSVGRKLPQKKPTLFMSGAGLSLKEEWEEPLVEEKGDKNKSERGVSALDNAIGAIDLASQLVPLEIGKGILTTVSSLLKLIKTTIQNKDDFIGISERCEKISMMLCRATSGKSQNEISPAVTEAIVDLNKSVNGIMEEVQARIESGVGSRAFHATVDSGNITSWQEKLDHFLVLFNAELHLASNEKMDEILAKFDELRDRMSVRLVDQPVALATVPPKPAIFVGREDIVQEAVQSLIQRKHVALLGLGGMGKTFIARAVLNDPTITTTFGQRRYFARYDDIDGSQITHGTFINRLATSIGLNGVRGKALQLIQITLVSSEPTLLVFDNAETFLDAEKDSGAIAESINEIGALANVVVLMTSRSTILPSNLPWDRVRVPPLDETPASALFEEIYTKHVDPQVLDGLLKSVDYHPLSINLLAQVAAQNDWTQEELVKAWEEQRAGLLETGSGKVQSLAATISLSLKSPSLWKHRDVVAKILPIIAFLPQGLNKTTLKAAYPELPQLQTIIDLLCKQSLTYFKGDFVTMLAPLRLHFSKDFNTVAQLPLLHETFEYYYSQLDHDPADRDWFHAEDINIEHLAAVLLQKALASNDIEAMIPANTLAIGYISHLADINPRPTSLRPLAGDLKVVERGGFLDYLNLKKSWRKHQAIKSKGVMFFQLGALSYVLGSLEDTRKFIVEARQLWKQTYINPSRLFSFCSMGVAATYLTLGCYTDAQRVLEADFGKINIRWRPWNRSQVDSIVPLMMHFIDIVAGRTQDVEQLFRLAKYAKHYGAEFWVSCAAMTIMAARLLGQAEKAQELVTNLLKESNKAERFETHLVAADFAISQGNAKQAETYLDAEPPTAASDIDETIAYYPLLAVCKVLVGKTEEATLILQQFSKDSRLANNILARTAMDWGRGWIALHSGDLASASASFQKVVSLAEISSDMIMAVSGHRGLGEIAFLDGDFAEAGSQFKRVIPLRISPVTPNVSPSAKPTNSSTEKSTAEETHPIHLGSWALSGGVLGRDVTQEQGSKGESQRGISALNHAIEAINLAGQLVPLELAKGVLGTVSSLLTLVKTTIQNKDDFIGISERCDKISMMLSRATSGRGQDEISPTVKDAITELEKSVNDIMVEVQARIESGVGSRTFHATVDRESIASWQGKLDYFLILFNSELQLSSNEKMDEILAKFDELRANIPGRLGDGPNVLAMVPPKPAIFVGREDIVQETIQSLIQRKHVALLGLGGMGKTFVARAVLNDPTIITTFGQRRYFARYDDIDGSQITHGTFINRLATSIGLDGIRGKALQLIQITLAFSEPTLLVFDNAETFLDAEKDGGAIAESINEIGALANVVVLMTSRSTILPSNLPWDRVRIPPLDETPANHLFRQIYTKHIDSQVLDRLLKSVDHHPLSINLLAQVAVQNEWSQEELVQAWEEQRAGLLETGSGKVQSLATTISLSLKSPSLRKHRDVVNKILPIIAFFPQGLNKATLKTTHLNLPQLQTVTELLCKHSLTYFKGDFVTMLAPLRLHFSRDFSTWLQVPLLIQIYQFYISQLGYGSTDKDWFRAEDTNIEHLAAVLLQKAIASNDSDSMDSAAGLAYFYIMNLTEFNPRPTSLSSLIKDLKIEENHTFPDYFNLKKLRQRHEITTTKGDVLFELGMLAYTLGSPEDARKFIVEARQLLKRTYMAPSMLRLYRSMQVAATYLTLGNYTDAQQVLEADFGKIGIHWRPWGRSELSGFHYVASFMLHFISIAAGRTHDIEKLFRLAKKMTEIDPKENLGVLCGSMIVMATRMLGQKEKARRMVTESDKMTDFDRNLLAADFSLYVGDAKLAEAYLDAAPPTAGGDIDGIIAYRLLLAICKVLVGKMEDARLILQQLSSDPRLANNIVARTAKEWMQGWIAFHSEISSYGIMAVSGHRGLGEIAFLNGDFAEAGTRFERVTSLCSTMGVVPAYVLEHHWMYLKLDDKFEGWKTFSQNKYPFSKEVS